jgi:hypothetical protein
MPVRRYRAFGLEIASEIELPAFAPGGEGPPEVEVTSEIIPEPRDHGDGEVYRNWVAREGLLDLDITGIARLRIEEGRRIRVEPSAGRLAEDAVSHIQGSAFAALLQQRGVVSMHAGTIETSLGAVLITGPSGAGKSTLLNAFTARGYRMLADDVTPITADADGRPLATPAFPASRLWRDSAEQLGHDITALIRVRDLLDKYYVAVPGYRDTPQRVAAVVVLAVSATGPALVHPLEPAERARSLVRYTYRKNFIRGQRLENLQFATVSALAEHAQVFQLRRPVRGTVPVELAGIVEAALGCTPVAAERASVAA